MAKNDKAATGPDKARSNGKKDKAEEPKPRPWKRQIPRHKDYEVCGARTRNETSENEYCQLRAGHGTNHKGVGRCKFHGGQNQTKFEQDHRYMNISRPRIKKLIEEYRKDPDPMNLLPEVLLLRALLTDFIERYDQMSEDLQRWNRAYGTKFRKAYADWYRNVMELAQAGTHPDEIPDPPEPNDFDASDKGIPDLAAVSSLVDKVGSMVERIERQRQTRAITFETLEQVLEQIGLELVQTLRREVADANTRARILEGFEYRWRRITIDSDGGVAAGSRTTEAN